MKVDPPGPHSLPCCDEAEAVNDGDLSPMPEVHDPEENNSCFQVSVAEKLQKENCSPCPFSVDPPPQVSSDAPNSPITLLAPESEEGTENKAEDKVHPRKQKIRTVFSDTQLCALRDRFQRQRYLSLQQMQELSAILNLSYKQVKTWFQNQRMKCKRWQNNQWPRTGNSVTQLSPGLSEHIQKPSSVGQPDMDQHLEQPDLDQPNLEQTGLEQPGLGQSNMEQPGLDQPNLEQPDLDQPNLEQPGLDQSVLVFSSLD
ncbi:Homeobox protein NANOG [Microtus ochrogaster]|uniref:Homeobox protein NANOG n=1 Tax=Microtus ochrogaster TaxID=79684 RepID=A0A8J6L3A6_MICOH|nr:Homeobox protein NANOG [Microtus ochrogaster]